MIEGESVYVSEVNDYASFLCCGDFVYVILSADTSCNDKKDKEEILGI